MPTARVAKKMVCFFVFLIVCWSPAVYQTYARPKWWGSESTPSEYDQAYFMMIAGYGALLNSAGDPWVIMFLLPGLQKDCWRKFMICICCDTEIELSREGGNAEALPKGKPTLFS